MKKKYKSIIIILSIIYHNISYSQTKLYCSYKNDINKNYKNIINNINSKTLFNDECSLSLLDSICKKYKATNDYKYLLLLDKFSLISDGYISEHIDDIIESLTIENTDGFLKYFCLKKNGTNTGLGSYFIYIFSNARIDSNFYLIVKKWVTKNQKKCSPDFIVKVNKIINKKK